MKTKLNAKLSFIIMCTGTKQNHSQCSSVVIFFIILEDMQQIIKNNVETQNKQLCS